MKTKHQLKDWYIAKSDNLIINVYLKSVTSLTEIWKWEIDFINTDKTIANTNGWAHTLTGAKAAATECAELFAGKGNVSKYYKQKDLYSDDEVV